MPAGSPRSMGMSEASRQKNFLVNHHNQNGYALTHAKLEMWWFGER